MHVVLPPPTNPVLHATSKNVPATPLIVPTSELLIATAGHSAMQGDGTDATPGDVHITIPPPM